MIKKLTFIFILGFCSSLYAQNDKKEDVGVITVEDTSENELIKLTHSPMPVSVIDTTKFHGRNISLNEVLKRVAGVKVKQQGGLGSRSTVAIQGLEGKRVKIYIDGSPLNSPDGTFGINDIPIQFIQRIEVYKGVVPARFGGDASGGAINVVTKDYKGDYIDLTYSTGSYGEHRAAFVFSKSFQESKFELGFGGFYNKAANDYIMNSPYVDNLKIKRDHAGFESSVLAAVLKIKDRYFDEIKVELIRYESKKEIQGILTPIKKAKDESHVNIAEFVFVKERFLHDNLRLDYKFAYIDLELNHIDKSETCYNFDGSERNCPGYGRGEVDGLPHDSADKQEDFRHDLNLHYILNNNHALNFHLNSQNSEYKPYDALASEVVGYDANVYPSDKTNTVTSLGLESSFLNAKLVNDMGIKKYDYDYKIVPVVKKSTITPKNNQQKGNEFGFYESIRYEPIKDLFVKASYEHAFRLPNSSEIFGDGAFITPATNLKPEEADNFNIGILFDRYDFYGLPWLKAEVNVFYKNLKEMIKLDYGLYNANYVNLGKIEVKGFELELSADLNENWYIYTNYTNQSLKDKQRKIVGMINTPNPTYNHDLPNIPKQYGNFGLEYKKLGVFRSDSLLKLFWEANWTDEYYYAWELSRHQKRKIDSQLSHTAGFEYSFKDDSYILGFEVRNLSDEKITDVFNYPLMGRTYHLNLRYTWF